MNLFPLQFDTLPISLTGPDEMQPGDLVFVSGIYNKERGALFTVELHTLYVVGRSIITYISLIIVCIF